MWLFSLSFLLLVLAGSLRCLKKQEAWMQELNKKEHKLFFFYPMVNVLIRNTCLNKILAERWKLNASIKALYVTDKPEVHSRIYWCKRISLVLAVFSLFQLVSLVTCLVEAGESAVMEEAYIKRPGFGEGSSEVELEVMAEHLENSGDSSKLPGTRKVIIKVKEQAYTSAEIKQIFDQAESYLKKEVLGENESAELIYQKLNFVDTIPDTGIQVDWIPQDYGLIRSDGTLCNEGIAEKGIQSTVTAVMTYGETKQNTVMTFTIMPKSYTEDELFGMRLKKALEAYSEKTATDEWMELPVILEQYRLLWSEQKKKSTPAIILLGFLFGAFVWIYEDRELDKRLKKRREQMLLDYPEIMNKFTLLINAGMTIRQAFIKIAEDYANQLSHRGSEKRYAYEEMLVTVHELQLGANECNSYEQYGKRIGLMEYTKFSSLMSQNLKKGTRGFTDSLMQEAREAFENRKETAKRLGEEAGTKLLIPMLLLMLLVFLIILIPAFISFRI